MIGRLLTSVPFREGPLNPLHQQNRRAGDELWGASIRTSGIRSPAFTVLFENDWNVEFANRLPQRDCSGFSPDSMTLSWLVEGRLGASQLANKTKPGYQRICPIYDECCVKRA